MGTQLDKQIALLLSKPKDYNYSDAKRLLTALGFVEDTKRSGSRVAFCRNVGESKQLIMLHKPHSNGILKAYQVNDIITVLKETGDIE